MPQNRYCIENRAADLTMNIYLALGMTISAAVDGIQNKIDPGDAADQDLYELPEDEVRQLPTVCGSLREALQSVDSDRSFLTEGGVFTDDQIDSYIDLKMEDVYDLEHSPHPIEFKNYYSV